MFSPLNIPDVSGQKLSGQARRNWIRTLIPGFLERGWKARPALRELQPFGLGIRPQDFHALWRDVAGIEAQANRARYVRKDARVSPDLFGEYRYKIKAKYYYVAEFEVWDDKQNRYIKATHGMMSDDVGTRADIEQQIFDDILLTSPELADKVRNVNLRKGFYGTG